MYKCVALMLVVTLLGIQCGGEEATNLQVSILNHPVGGLNVETVTCSFQARITDGDESITATLEWWLDYFGQFQQVVSTEQWTFYSYLWHDVTTSYTIAPGYMLDGEYWVRIEWRDSKRNEHSITSARCLCSVVRSVAISHRPMID